ncbi:hypothetical protein GJ496_002863 [Pomphorhynchus laevis]|nr:hypothetical protein GJ496_002863 [Pomphorhynchus laevis]
MDIKLYRSDTILSYNIYDLYNKRIDKQLVYNSTLRAKQALLTENKYCFEVWKYKLHCVKSIYYILSNADLHTIHNIFILYCWVPDSEFELVQTECEQLESILRKVKDINGSCGPLHYRSNSVLSPSVQSILGNSINQQSSAEFLNPAFFSLIPFCFLFSCMFADIGHSILLLFLYIFMITLKMHDNLKEMLPLVAMCCAFSIYTGFIYGECFGLGISISTYSMPSLNSNSSPPIIMYSLWHHSLNKIQFTNSLKMKNSIIIGAFLCGYGHLLAIWQCMTVPEAKALLVKYIPYFICHCAIIGYLSLLIILKWVMKFKSCPPSLYEQYINMFLPGDKTNLQCTSQLFFVGQTYIQNALLIILSISVILSGVSVFWLANNMDDGINHIINWIESTLAHISHGASFLRIWAIGLAHNQLSDLALIPVIYCFYGWPYIGKISRGIILSLVFTLWLFLTFFMLILLESAIAALHALRLNWIEIQSKFVDSLSTTANKTCQTHMFTPLYLKNNELVK